jgi:hypothetical protein
VRPAQHHPSPHQGVEGSRCACTDQEPNPQPCPPASPSGVVGRSSRLAGSQQIHSPPCCSPRSCTASNWADVVRGVDFTHQEAPAASSADVIALYKRYAALGYQARFSVKSGAGYKEVSLSCHFPVPSAVSCLSSQPFCNRRCQCWRIIRDSVASQLPGQPAPKLSLSSLSLECCCHTCHALHRHRLLPKPPP